MRRNAALNRGALWIVGISLCGLWYALSSGCFGTPDLRGLKCQKDSDCLRSFIKCLDGYCGGITGAEEPVVPEPEPVVERPPPEPRQEAPNCPSPKALCGSACVDLQANASHCGQCDRACGSGLKCQRGQCESLAYVACGASPTRCTAPFTCVQINPIGRPKDMRCLKACTKGGSECGEDEICSAVPGGVGLACFQSCKRIPCKDLRDSSLYCSSSQLCLSGTCDDFKDECKDPVEADKYACVNYSQPGQTAAYRCATACTQQTDCPLDHECRCAQGKRGCGDGKPGVCLKTCDVDQDCQKTDPNAVCALVDSRKFCLHQ